MKKNNSYAYILKSLPYSEPFLFVDEIIEVTELGVIGSYTYAADSDFYRGHFKDNPVTPGVILTETMAQIGLVCLGINLIKQREENVDNFQIAMTSNEVEYLLPVYPNEKVIVKSEKVYFRFGKLKCKVVMRNADNEVVCQGTIAGMIKLQK
ncbi:MAG: 3-hydroxyacyl-[acyl-carrier-protein] dehydratase [Saprospiraceae bacterium]|jgi:3-hydroxyacyl-[acyl-carrier-protein] dehydratase|tara:strand:- start:854 stop:1309 length:456 start_codon:yes stop_codon:yes gene_type:complete